MAAMRVLIAHGADVHAVDDPLTTGRGLTPLHLAARGGRAATAALLLDHGANVNAADSNGDTPLHIAVRSNDREMARFLLTRTPGANVDLANRNGDTPLHLAAWAGDVDMVKLLLAHRADPSAKDYHKQTPLDLARQQGHSAVAKLLGK